MLQLQTAPPSTGAEQSPPSLEALIPEDGAEGVPTDTIIALRFSKAMKVQSIISGNITLQGPTGMVPSKVVPVENGMLAFLTPAALLSPGTQYTVKVDDVTDPAHAILPTAVVTFATLGADGIGGSTGGDNGKSDWRQLPPLQAPPGITALAGQTLTLDGKPLPHVTFDIGGIKARSDGTGRFLLVNIGAKHQSLFIDGRTASTPKKTYGTFEGGIEIEAGRTNVLNFTIWMPVIDTAHAVTIPSPTTSEVVVTTPYVPGLELHIPPNAVLRDHDGNVVHHVSLTQIPVDRPPFPLAYHVQVPIYFTAQPGGAYIQVYVPGKQLGAQIFYPNYTHLAPGTREPFWHYDPDGQGWYVYGEGTASRNGSQIVPDPGTQFYEFTGSMFGGGANLPGVGPSGPGDGEPVDLATGLFVYHKTDLYVDDIIPISLTRVYQQSSNNGGEFGSGMHIPYDLWIWNPAQYAGYYLNVDLVFPDGSRVNYIRTSPGNGNLGAVFEDQTSSSIFYRSQLYWNGLGWTLVLKDGTKLLFGNEQPLYAIVDRYGNTLNITRPAPNGNITGDITKITSPNGRWIQFTVNSNYQTTQAQDNMGRSVYYSYGANGVMTQFTDAAGGIWQYTYDSSNRMTSITDPRNITYLQNFYDVNGRVYKQVQADGGTYLFNYTTDSAGNVTKTDVTDPRGNVRRVIFNSPIPNAYSGNYTTGGTWSSDTSAYGTSLQNATSFDYGQSQVNTAGFLLGTTDALGPTAQFSYDAKGNLISVTKLAGSSQASTTTLTYEPTFNQLTNMADPLGHVTSYQYDSSGNLVTAVDPLGNTSTFTYSGSGQLLTASDAMGNTAHLSYSGPDLASFTDPTGRTITLSTDAVGRVTAITDPQGLTTGLQYNNLDLTTQITDRLGQITSFGYDANGNLTSVADPQHPGAPTIFGYDNMDRVLTRTDPLNRAEHYQYDGNDNLTQFTDRRGKVTSFQFDALDRLTFAGFGTTGSGSGTSYASTISYTYDSGDRLTQMVDSIAGTVTHTFDGLDQLMSETSPQGSVSYTYDAAGRRTMMQVAGQTAINYSYDSADHPTQVTQGTTTLGLAYDSAGRRSTLTLPNGIVASYTYAKDSRIAGISYSRGGTLIGDLSYAYDALGRTTLTTGTLATTVLPSAINSATYDAANELTNWNGTAISYDGNGNMLSDGTRTFTWDARNQLATVNGIGLQYDAFGRRSKNAAGTSFLYDRGNIVQELSGTTVMANVLSGGIDEVFNRSDSFGTFAQLRDELGSTNALTDGNGTISTSYAYDPFGNTSVSGLSNSNTFQYAGRENEGNGLYFYRARYYNPTLSRFLSEDPIGFAGGDTNLYRYAGDDPVDFVDPMGTDYHVSQNGNTINVSAVVYLDGTANDAELINLMLRGQQAIENYWNRGGNHYKYKNCIVNFKITFTDRHGRLNRFPNAANNHVQVQHTPGFRSDVRNGNSGVWSSDLSEWGFAHETGHFLGLPDEYTDVGNTSPAWPGREFCIMGRDGQFPCQSEINQVLRGRGCHHCR